MEMEVVVPKPPPSPPPDFNFDSTCSSPYMTAPSSPQRFGNFFFSAPTSPTRISTFYREFNEDSSSTIPFRWEEKPATPKREERNDNGGDGKDGDGSGDDDDDDEDFEFNFSGQLDTASLSAEELFDGGKIRPLKPPSGYDSSVSFVSSPRSPKSSRISRKKAVDPFQVAVENQQQERINHQQRGRKRISSSSSSNFARKGSRSLSPLRVSDTMFEEEGNSQNVKMLTSTGSNLKPSYMSTLLSAISFSNGPKKWKLKDFLLFRSASEGRATGKDPLTKYTMLSKRDLIEDSKSASFRSMDSVGSSMRRGPMSAHELHYTVNRAVSEEMKRKTFLPYKQGLLGCLGFNPGVNEISRGVGSWTRG